MVEYTFSKFVYMDTNILSHLSKNRKLWPNLFEFLRNNDLTMGVGGPQIVELADVNWLHKEFVALCISVPTGLLKNWDLIIEEEVKSHPNMQKESLLLFPLNALLLETNGLDKLYNLLSSSDLEKARKDQLKSASQMQNRLGELKENFPLNKNGKYSRNQADEFANSMTIQWLAYDYKDFLKSLKYQVEEEGKSFSLDVFESIRLYAYVIFYKYYIGNREPKLSDFGDLAHLFIIPYCDIAIMERDLCNVLNQIKKNHTILESTKIYNIDYINSLENKSIDVAKE